ncbi:winged helix-turn-helix transcriptional regulator [Streptomyces chromofuscus]|uniref:winged helix-turn-helix transcriptional regulator n=1 Tax=Streptomyces chromofuscus TaxID=42881 RepID=UPI0027E40F2D|nr:winged helix-turn-helix transcriptional regulator [Streptomyces chromofuscus]
MFSRWTEVLTRRRRRMERDGPVISARHPDVPPRVEHEIGDLGRRLASIFTALARRSAENLPGDRQARRIVRRRIPSSKRVIPR